MRTSSEQSAKVDLKILHVLPNVCYHINGARMKSVTSRLCKVCTFLVTNQLKHPQSKLLPRAAKVRLGLMSWRVITPHAGSILLYVASFCFQFHSRVIYKDKNFSISIRFYRIFAWTRYWHHSYHFFVSRYLPLYFFNIVLKIAKSADCIVHKSFFINLLHPLTTLKISFFFI